jgi:hypothetical protein
MQVCIPTVMQFNQKIAHDLIHGLFFDWRMIIEFSNVVVTMLASYKLAPTIYKLATTPG